MSHLPHIESVRVEFDGEPFAEFDVPHVPFVFEISRMPRDAVPRTIDVYTLLGGAVFEHLPTMVMRYPDICSIRIEPFTFAEPADAFDALADAWFASERARTCPPNCADCAEMEG